jgi:hypothetical protein
MAERSEKLFFHATPDVKAEVERFAAEEQRSVSNALARITADWLARRKAARGDQQRAA